MSEEDDLDFLSIIGLFAGLDFLSHVPELYTLEEAQELKREATSLWQTASWLQAKLYQASDLLGGTDKGWDGDKFSSSLAKIALTSYRIGAATSLHNSNKRKISRDATALGRIAAKKKNINRDQLLDIHFGRFISLGLKGEKLRDAILDMLSGKSLAPGQHKPSLRAVTGWATNYRRNGSWRPLKKSDAQS